MSSTEYLSRLDDRRIGRLVALATETAPEEVLSCRTVRTSDGPWCASMTRCLVEHDAAVVEACYQIDDYTIEPLTGDAPKEATLTWRSYMYQMFGTPYARAFLMEERSTNNGEKDDDAAGREAVLV